MKLSLEEGKGEFDQRSTEVIDRRSEVSEMPPRMQNSDDRDVHCGMDQVRDRSEDRPNDKDEIKVVQHKEDAKSNDQELLDKVSIYRHESGDLYAEDVDQHMAILPEVSTPTAEVTIDDIQVGDPGVPLTDDQEKLQQLIWRNRHLLIGKENALPPAARGVICDIDVGGASPIAQRVRPVAPKFWEKLADLIKGLLSAKIIRPSTSPWASPIVVIIKKYGEDIRLCIDYRRVNQLTRLMVYPMPLISELLQDMDKAMWYCSLDMASGSWAVEMTERARAISAFITPSGLFEWLRMPFGLKNAPQIYQRLIANDLYGYLKIGSNPESIEAGSTKLIDVFIEGEPDTDPRPSVLGRRSYIDDILIPARPCSSLYAQVERLLEVCNKWNLSISLAKSVWGRRKVDYLGHQISLARLEANPKDLGSLVNIPFPRTLRSMQSFLGSLNYYSRFIENFAIYASVLYKLRESDFHEINRTSDFRMSSAEVYLSRKLDRDRNPTSISARDPELIARGDPDYRKLDRDHDRGSGS